MANKSQKSGNNGAVKPAAKVKGKGQQVLAEPPVEEEVAVVSSVSEEQPDTGWSVEDTPAVTPVTTGWASEQEEDQAWQASQASQPANADLASQEEDDTLLPADGEEVLSEEWSAGVSPLTLSIEQHSGVFNPAIAKIMIFGETGTEKTRTASTFPHVIFADIDHGMASVTEHVDKVYIDDDERGFRQLKALYEFLRDGDHTYETVVLDTLNEMQRILMRFTIEEFTHIRRSYGNLPGQSDYGKMLYEFMELTRNFISLPMRVVLLAQVNSQQFDTDILGPQLIGKNTARELARKMDVIGYIYKAQGADDRTHPEISFDSSAYVTKDRSNRLPSVLPNPSYGRIAAYWQ